MGLFDRIIVKQPLPLPLAVVDVLPNVYEKEFQTKDLENFLVDYILEDDKLFEVKVQREWQDDDDAFLKGHFKVVSEEIVASHFYGAVNFYCYERLHTGENQGLDISLDYLAKFNDGVLVDLSLLGFEIEDASKDILATKQFYRDLEMKRNKWYNKYIFLTRPVTFIRRKIIRFFGHIHSLTGKLHTFVIRHL